MKKQSIRSIEPKLAKGDNLVEGSTTSRITNLATRTEKTGSAATVTLQATYKLNAGKGKWPECLWWKR
jgi:hypothetical protein